MDIPDVALGAIVAALVTSVAGVLGLIISKENKVSEFRLQWIEDVRKEVSDLYACLITIRLVLRRDGRGGHADQFLNDANRHFANIRLRLNTDDDKYRQLCGILDEIETLYAAKGGPNYERMEEVNTDMLMQTRALLRSEWQKVQEGEPIFRHARFGLIAAFVIVLAYLGKLVFWSPG